MTPRIPLPRIERGPARDRSPGSFSADSSSCRSYSRSRSRTGLRSSISSDFDEPYHRSSIASDSEDTGSDGSDVDRSQLLRSSQIANGSRDGERGVWRSGHTTLDVRPSRGGDEGDRQDGRVGQDAAGMGGTARSHGRYRIESSGTDSKAGQSSTTLPPYSPRRGTDLGATLHGDPEPEQARNGWKQYSTRRMRGAEDASRSDNRVAQQASQGGLRPTYSARPVRVDSDDSDVERGRGQSRSRGVKGAAFRPRGNIFAQLFGLAALHAAGTPDALGGAADSSSPKPIRAPVPRPRSLSDLSSDEELELDENDPRVTGILPVARRRRQALLSDIPFVNALADLGEGEEKKPARKGKKRPRRQHPDPYLADIQTCQSFILKLAKALMNFGAPSHRIESQLAAVAIALDIDAQFIHFPSLVIASFGNPVTRTSETHFIKASGGDLDLGKLHQIHGIYKAVVRAKMDAVEGTRAIHSVLRSERTYKLWQRMILAFVTCGLIAPMCASGSVLDMLAAGVLGTMLSFLQMNMPSQSAIYSNVFEITMATFISFVSRGLSASGYFCYGSVISSGVSNVLPGYSILCGALELASMNIVAGSVRMVFAIIFSLFLGFGITIGSDLFYIVDPPARRAVEAIFTSGFTPTTLAGTFSALSSADNSAAWNGTFTFLNSTSQQLAEALDLASLACPREASWPWYRQAMPEIYLLALVPLYSLFTALWCFQPLRSKEMPVQVLISSIGFGVNNVANRYIFHRDDVTSAIGAFVIGLMGHLYARMFKGTSFTSMVPGIMFLVPSGLTAAGGLAMANIEGQPDAFADGLVVGGRMVQVAIGITIGLFGSGFLIYSFGRKKNRTALFAF